MKTTLKLCALLLALGTVLSSFGGCDLFGKDNLPEKELVDHVYRYETTELAKADTGAMMKTASSSSIRQNFGQTSLSPCGYLYTVNSYNADTYMNVGCEIRTGDFSGGGETVVDLGELTSETQNGWIASALRMEDGVIVLLETSKLIDEETYQYEDKFELRKYGFDGTLQNSTDLKPLLGIPADTYFYINRIVTDGKNLYFVYGGEEGRSPLIMLDQDLGVRTYDGFLPEGQEVWISSLFLLDEKTLVCVYESYSADAQSVKSRALDLESGAARDLPYDFTSFAYSAFGGRSGVYGVNENGVVKFTEDGASEIELDFINSDYIYSYGEFFAEEGGDFLLLAEKYDEKETTLNLTRFTKVPDSEITPKWLITVASAGNSYNFREQIVDFNRAQDDYRIKYTDYAQYNTNDDYELGRKTLESELLSGKVPDVLIADSNFSAQNYLRKGLFTDLYPLMEEDGDVKKEDFIPGVLSAAAPDGKLLELPTNILLCGMICKNGTADRYRDLSLSDFAAAAKALPEDVTLFRIGDMNRENMLKTLFENNYARFINNATASAAFAGDDFKAILDIASLLPEKYYWEDDNFNYEDFDWQAYDNAFAEDKALFLWTTTGSFEEFGNYGNMFRTRDYSMIAAPSADGKISFSTANLKFLISEQCLFKDAAWDFVKIFFSADYQSKQTWGFPVTLPALEQARDRAIENLKDEDNGATYETLARDVMLPNPESEIYRVTEEQIAEMYDLVRGVEKQNIVDESIEDILVEETSAFFAGQKSAEAVASLLDSRVALYLGEQR